eukprot:TRINITY_DN3112_c0_g2_i1.p1 TRINITY_DN3112_c0_g2~~TRINITY_DN3112_c0_g2_i1.p1  ORF type:complete len:635 (-),score=124.37 TRINITY_DN3112_c0_g2_i1:286-2160(-)
MSAAQAMGISGGWPLNVFVTPELKPFLAGTYYPRRSFLQILGRMSALWRKDREHLQSISHQLHHHISTMSDKMYASTMDKTQITLKDNYQDLFLKAFQKSRENFDGDFGGFGKAPKFPQGMQLQMLMRIWRRSGHQQLLDMVTATLNGMARGGMYDHLGGGFCRYSTDEKWLIPHFEKMLCDNATLALTYLEAFTITQNPMYASVARETLDYITDTMENKAEGGYFSAEDADSEGVEGKYYVWTTTDIHKILTDEEAAAVISYYNVTKDGNFEHHTNNLNMINGSTKKKQTEWSEKYTNPVLKSACAKMKKHRDLNRIHPLKDDKQLSGWNGLMIAAMARAGCVLHEPKYIQSAQCAARFIQKHLTRHSAAQNQTILLRRFRDGEAKYDGTLDDYAYVVFGLLELYQADFGPQWLKFALELQKAQDELFWDDKAGGYFFTPKESKQVVLIARSKEFVDDSCPNSNAVSARNLLVLYHLTLDNTFSKRTESMLAAAVSFDLIYRIPTAFFQLLIAMDFATDNIVQINLICPAGAKSAEITAKWMEKLRALFAPSTVVAVKRKEGDEKIVKCLEGKTPISDNKMTCYVCVGQTCTEPFTDVDMLAEKVKGAVNKIAWSGLQVVATL